MNPMLQDVQFVEVLWQDLQGAVHREQVLVEVT